MGGHIQVRQNAGAPSHRQTGGRGGGTTMKWQLVIQMTLELHWIPSPRMPAEAKGQHSNHSHLKSNRDLVRKCRRIHGTRPGSDSH